MTDILTALDQIPEDLNKFGRDVSALRAKNVPTVIARPVARAVARLYFESIRPELEVVQNRSGLVEEIDHVLQSMLRLASASREKQAYLGQISELTPYLFEAQVDIMKARGSLRLILSETERAILETLAKMLPGASASYEQARRDIREGARVSWRGTASELREVLREVIDYLAPDEKVMGDGGFQRERGQTAPTQKQKVRFILRARRSSSTAFAVAKASLARTDEATATLVRSTYQRGSASTHALTSGSEIRKLKGYVDALLVELLEVS